MPELAPQGTFTVKVGFQRSRRKHPVYIKVSRVMFSISGSPGKSVTHAPYRATLTLRASTKPGSRVTVRAGATIKRDHDRVTTKSIAAKVTVCS
jgi:hypothetical protein